MIKTDLHGCIGFNQKVSNKIISSVRFTKIVVLSGDFTNKTDAAAHQLSSGYFEEYTVTTKAESKCECLFIFGSITFGRGNSTCCTQ